MRQSRPMWRSISLSQIVSNSECLPCSYPLKNPSWGQSYVIKSAPWTNLWFRILGIFSVEYIKRLCVFMFQTCSNSQLLRRVLWISAEQTIGASLKHKNTQPLYIFSRVRVLHLNRLKERTWLHSFEIRWFRIFHTSRYCEGYSFWSVWGP